MRGPAWLDAEARKARAYRDPLEMLYPDQREMAQAVLAPNARVADHSGRGSGKTEGLAHVAQKLLRDIKGAKIAWLGLTAKSAKDNAWGAMARVNDELGGPLVPREHEYRWTSSTGGLFAMFGCNKNTELDKLRGSQWDLVVIDESAFFSPARLKYLVESVIGPRLVDRKGRIALIGSPGVVPSGYYFEVCQGSDGFVVFCRTMRDNPFLDGVEEWLALEMERRGWSPDHPTFQREILGRWVRDRRNLVFEFEDGRNTIASMPDGYRPGAPGWSHAISIDFGVEDSTAWVVWAYRVDKSGDTCAYVVEAFKWHSGVPDEYVDGLDVRPGNDDAPGDDLYPSAAATITQRIQEKYSAYPIVGDTGGIGKGFQTEAQRRFGISIKAADKVDKAAKIELVNDALRTSKIKIVAAARHLVDELKSIQWRVKTAEGGYAPQRDDDSSVRRENRQVDKLRFENHLADALQYGFTELKAMWNTAPKIEPKDPALERPWQPVKPRRKPQDRSYLRGGRQRSWWEERG